ncbi:GGDEF domain-containing protein [Pseudoalteromonas shioyasakiensis]|uniref:GGDEF domain-containing protein n=1 Tax=Pseudoalteromonas shioyasakiensis TaxID=1190813 RepID=UPI0021199496|nr:GGDEF domain-containing protein [Pseudoalteromonas shioyasakiensis]MCQ8878581.1 GGDEF domain-containing protein [Pseudoalteromonas shioyasakiensis]
MKHPYWIAVIWAIVFICIYGLLKVESPNQDTIEELFWAGISISLTLQVYAYISNKLLIGAWIIYNCGLLFDLLDDLIDTQFLPLLLFDTTLKNIGFILTCAGLILLIKDKRKTIKLLNEQIQASQVLQQKLAFEASHDQLTSLGNRRACFTRFEQLKSHYYRVYYFDLDNFKHANDTYGHQCGDEILIDFSKRLCAHFSAENCFRLGGDEFVAFCNDKQLNIELVRNDLCRFMHDFGMGVSIGYANLNPDEDTDAIIHKADQRMYEDKTTKTSRNTAVN